MQRLGGKMTLTETLDRLDELDNTASIRDACVNDYIREQFRSVSRQVRALIAENERMRRALLPFAGQVYAEKRRERPLLWDGSWDTKYQDVRNWCYGAYRALEDLK